MPVTPIPATPGTSGNTTTLFICRDPEAMWLAGQATSSGATLTLSWDVITATSATTISTTTASTPAYLPPEYWEQVRREQEAAELRAQVADARATQLLWSLLTPAQRRTYSDHGWFAVRGSAGGRYRVHRNGHAGNVDELDANGYPVATWCCHPPGALPDADAHIAQLLTLQCDEPGFRAVGNQREHPAVRLANRPLVAV
jgi:hypothetical protein